MKNLSQDLLYGCQMLLKKPAFTIVAALLAARAASGGAVDARPVLVSGLPKHSVRLKIQIGCSQEVTYENLRLRDRLVCTECAARGAVAEVSRARHPAHRGRQAESYRARAAYRGRQTRPV